ncbi:beta-galactosidase [Candidatus Moduliflexus flocculans]|uniref:Beta-galactosidase n=1 Tax=Candidatus Moduliflexus flocculans TaxID=1499966 RepID=A0A081BT91_9BACT|nr:beta-galactosidase [Candidatus Moduliflexus flocculans]
MLKPTTATVVARYRQDYYAGKPAITVNQHGKGRVVYVGTVGETGFYRVLAKWLIKMAGIAPLMNVPQGIEVTERQQGRERLLFVMNHTDQPQVMMLEERYRNILNDQMLEGEISIAPRDVFILCPIQ